MRKYKLGKRVKTVGAFEKCNNRWYMVYFGPVGKRTIPKTTHRGFLEAWQYHTLKMFIDRGAIYEAKPIEKEGK